VIYADTDFFVALIKEDDWLQERAKELLEKHRGEIRTSLPTFIELFLLSEDYEWDRDRMVANVLELVETDFDENIPFQASEYMSGGLNVFDAFQAACSDRTIISSDKEFDGIGLERVELEKADG